MERIARRRPFSRRRARDIEDARQALEAEDVSAFLHISGISNPADVGTKKNPSPGALTSLRELLSNGNYAPEASSLTNETIAPDQDTLASILEQFSVRIII